MFAPIRPTPTNPIFSFMEVNLMFAVALPNHNHAGVAFGQHPSKGKLPSSQ